MTHAPTINQFGDEQIPASDIETIIKARVQIDELGATLVVSTDSFRSLRLHIEHKDYEKQQQGQEAFSRLCRSCAITQINDAEELIGKKIQWKWLPGEIETGKLPPACPVWASPPPVTPAPIRRQDGKYIYVISCIDTDEPLCKIGIATSAESRMRSISTSSPHALRLEMARFTEAARSIETQAHAHFDSHRKNGEWFEMPAIEAITYINKVIDARSVA